MKILIASDVHGSKSAIEKIVKRFDEEKADKLVLLGDIYYHGPRNPLPDRYNPMEVANILNKRVEDLIVIKGNCDAEVDQMISKFSFVDEAKLLIGNKVVTFTHGHKVNKDNYDKNVGDILVYGHFHINFIEKKGDIIFVNPGSISLPKCNSCAGYVIIDEKSIIQKDLEGKIIDLINI